MSHYSLKLGNYAWRSVSLRALLSLRHHGGDWKVEKKKSSFKLRAKKGFHPVWVFNWSRHFNPQDTNGVQYKLYSSVHSIISPVFVSLFLLTSLPDLVRPPYIWNCYS